MTNGFTFNNVVPVPMAQTHFNAQSLWGKTQPLTIPAGQSSLIIAPSGSGKTTLIAYMYGMRNDYTGNITLQDENLKTNLNLNKWCILRQQKISIIFQDLRLLPELTVGENLLLKNKLTQHKTTQEIQHMLACLGVADKWEQTCGTLSYGQQQRVAIVRALLQPFDFLLADEPFSHLDDSNIEKARVLIENECLQKKAACVVFSLGNAYNMNVSNTFYL